MAGDPSAPSVAGIHAFGATDFDARGAFASLARAATVPTALDLSDEGCRICCVGQRPSLDQWLSLNYIATGSNSWGGAGETLESAIADFSLSQMAERLGESDLAARFLASSNFWENLWNPRATPDRGYIQNRNADGTWPRFDPASSRGFAEGSSAQYTWMVPHDVRGLFDRMGGDEAAVARLDAFFHLPDGGWALTDLGGMHAEMDNEPSVGTPWLYLFAGRPEKTQATLRRVLDSLWSDRPGGIPGNDDLGSMSSWYVWAAMGLYPGIPGRADLLLGSPLFDQVEVQRGNGRTLTVTAPAPSGAIHVTGLRVNGRDWPSSWVPEHLLGADLVLEFGMGREPSPTWGRRQQDTPPSLRPPAPR
jgi:predicted alpha-1,2-mannosidase